MERFTKHYLQKLTVRFYWIIMVPTQRSIDNFGFLIGGVNGSRLHFLHEIADTIYRQTSEL